MTYFCLGLLVLLWAALMGGLGWSAYMRYKGKDEEKEDDDD